MKFSSPKIHSLCSALLILLLGLTLAACGGADDTDGESEARQDSLSKAEAEEALSKGDISFDPCERYGWYDDG
ncbi:MAG: hypothetical protein ACNA8W_26175, partial [Bradymonadaceae bacterium]